MAPTLMERYYYGCSNYDAYGNCYSSPWNSWGRWVALVCIIVFALFIAVLFSCINARRRRRQGLPPRYGTGWTAGGKWGSNRVNNQPTNYYNNQPYNGGVAPAPPYSPPVQNQYTGNTHGSNDGYYGQQSGVELQPPKNTYPGQRGGDPVYEAPQGPPPNKGAYGDGIVR